MQPLNISDFPLFKVFASFTTMLLSSAIYKYILYINVSFVNSRVNLQIIKNSAFSSIYSDNIYFY